VVDPQTWTVIRFNREVSLPRFTVFAGETWTTYRDVGDRFALGAGMLDAGSDFTILYQGDRRTARTHEAGPVLRRCEHGTCRGCDVCGGRYARKAAA
jgi:hypothetical protein